MSTLEPTTDESPPARPHRGRLRVIAMWLGGALAILLLALTLPVAWWITHPMDGIAAVRWALRDTAWELTVESATLEREEGWLKPYSWRWHVKGLVIVGAVPRTPTLRIDDMVLAPPRMWWTPGGLLVRIPAADIERLDLHLGGVVTPAETPVPGTRRLTILVEQLDVERFGMTMERGLNPEVVLVAHRVGLKEPFVLRPFQQEVTGSLLVGVGSVDVAGVPLRDLHPSRLEFTGHGLEVVSSATFGGARVAADLSVVPLIGRPEVEVNARMTDGTLAGIAGALLGPGDLLFLGGIDARVSLRAGGELGPGHLAGSATVDVRGAGFSKPEAKRALIVLAVTLAPFLHFDDDRNVVIGDLHGDVSFNQRGVTFESVVYETAHSVGELKGYARSTGLSAKLHFRPRPGSAAIEWGLILRGDLRKPRVAVTVPSILRAWTPCEDAAHCALVGGASTDTSDADQDEQDAAAVEAELLKEARADAAQTRRDDRVDARETRRTDRADAKAARQEERAASD